MNINHVYNEEKGVYTTGTVCFYETETGKVIHCFNPIEFTGKFFEVVNVFTLPTFEGYAEEEVSVLQLDDYGTEFVNKGNPVRVDNNEIIYEPYPPVVFPPGYEPEEA